jgi:aminoglycoside 2''-phosphotransferase
MELMPHPGWGGDSDAWLVDGSWIFRFPRSADVARRLAVEIALLPRLAPALPLPIPEFTYVVHGHDGNPAFVGYRAIPGIPFRATVLAGLPTKTADCLARRLGDFLRALHATAVEDAVACGIKPPTLSPRQAYVGWFRRVEAAVFPVLDDDERAWVTWRFGDVLAEPFRYDFAPTLCHGDLTSDHILFDAERGELAGIIDFGDLTIGDRAGEFTWWAEYGDDFFHSALAAYQSTDRTLANRVVFQIDCQPLVQILFGLETGRSADVAEGRRDLRLRMSASRGIDRG